MKLYFSENLKKIDKESYDVFGYSERVLMENAGGGCYREFLKLYDEDFLKKASIVVICGKSNNGGDGFVLSRYLFNNGLNVKTIVLSNKDLYKGAARNNLDTLIRLGAEVVEISSQTRSSLLPDIFEHADVLVDAIFGVGLNREIKGFFKEVIELLNNKSEMTDSDVICIDVPSGLNSDNGKFMGVSVKNRIKRVFTLGGSKVGFYINEGEKLLLDEKVTLININQPVVLLEKYCSKIEVLSESDVVSLMPARQHTAVKFDYGHLLVIAGSYGKSGAAYMSSLAGFKGGAGLVTAAVPSSLNNIMEMKTTEIMTYPVFDDNEGFFVEKSAADIVNNVLKGKTAVVIGPGIGLNLKTKLFLRRLLPEINVPIIIDADALNILSEDLDILRDIKSKKDIILTPHFKEMERLTGVDRRIIAEDPLKAGLEFTEESGAYLILKDSSMFIFNKNAVDVSIQTKHSSLMASGGSGDVLSGIIGSFICQGMPLYDAMKVASYIIVYSAKDLSLRCGDFGVGAAEIARNIPYATKKLRNLN